MEMNFSPCLFFRSGISLLRLQDIDNQTGKQIGGFVYNRNIRRLTLKLVQSLFMNLRLGRPDSFFANQTQNPHWNPWTSVSGSSSGDLFP